MLARRSVLVEKMGRKLTRAEVREADLAFRVIFEALMRKWGVKRA